MSETGFTIDRGKYNSWHTCGRLKSRLLDAGLFPGQEVALRFVPASKKSPLDLHDRQVHVLQWFLQSQAEVRRQMIAALEKDRRDVGSTSNIPVLDEVAVVEVGLDWPEGDEEVVGLSLLAGSDWDEDHQKLMVFKDGQLVEFRWF